VIIGATIVNALTYNGARPGSTLLMRPGNTLTVSLANRLNVSCDELADHDQEEHGRARLRGPEDRLAHPDQTHCGPISTSPTSVDAIRAPAGFAESWLWARRRPSWAREHSATHRRSGSHQGEALGPLRASPRLSAAVSDAARCAAVIRTAIRTQLVGVHKEAREWAAHDFVEPPVRIELTTFSLRVRCSTD
jgi:hypothetical protein